MTFSIGRLARPQDKTECRLEDGDTGALDDTKLEHPFRKKLPFLCWLFDYSDKRHVWFMNVISTWLSLRTDLHILRCGGFG